MLRDLPEEVRSGRDPEAFAAEMSAGFYYGEQRLFQGERGTPSEFLALVRKSDLPETLRRGFGEYEAATLRSQGGPPTVSLHESEAVAEIEWNRMLPEEVTHDPDSFNLLKDL